MQQAPSCGRASCQSCSKLSHLRSSQGLVLSWHDLLRPPLHAHPLVQPTGIRTSQHLSLLTWIRCQAYARRAALLHSSEWHWLSLGDLPRIRRCLRCQFFDHLPHWDTLCSILWLLCRRWRLDNLLESWWKRHARVTMSSQQGPSHDATSSTSLDLRMARPASLQIASGLQRASSRGTYLACFFRCPSECRSLYHRHRHPYSKSHASSSHLQHQLKDTVASYCRFTHRSICRSSQGSHEFHC